MRNNFDAVNVKVTKNLVINKVHVVISFILAFKHFWNSFPKQLIVGYFSGLKFNPISHIP